MISRQTQTSKRWLVNAGETPMNVVKLIRANGGYLGTQRRRRTWLPTKYSGELEANIEPEVSEWGNPKYSLLNI